MKDVTMMAAVGEPPELKKFSGMQRAAALMLSLGHEQGGPIWDQLTTEEIKELSSTISQLGRVPAVVVEYLLVQFSGEVSSMSTLHGSYETTERLLEGIMPTDKVKEIMEDIRGPSGRTMWDKLSNVSEAVLAGYLKNEYPQTVAVILHKLRPITRRGCFRNSRASSPPTSSCACCAWTRCRRTCWSRSSRRSRASS